MPYRLSARAGVLILAALLSSCTPERATAPAATDALTVSAARGTTTSYAVTEIGTLPGDVESYAFEVNNAGQVVVQSQYFSMSEPRTARWYIRSGGQNTMFTEGAINSIGNAAVTRVGGGNGTAPMVWTFDPATGFSAGTELDYSGAPSGTVQVVNETGDAAGSVGTDAAIWKADGTRIIVANVNPAVFESGSVRDINNSGDAVIQYHDNSGLHRGYVRTSDGAMIELPVYSQHSSLVRGVSEMIDGKILVAGTVDERNGNYRAVKWTVDPAARWVISRHSLADRSYSTAMADDGTIVGDLSGSASTTAFVWTASSLISLKTPKGSNSGRTWSVSANGKYISGDARYSGGYRKAVLWTAP